jgi:hypothetical protein
VRSTVVGACVSFLLAAVFGGCSKSPAPAAAPGGGVPSQAHEMALRPDQVRFQLGGIASAVRVERRPATRLTARPVPGTRAMPAHLLFVLDPATLPDPALPEARALIVYPAADWSRIYARLGRADVDPVPALSRLLETRPAEVNIAFPPSPAHENARQILRTAVRYIEFRGGRGVRFLTVYQADPLPIADRDVVYVFNGLTDDRVFWVTLDLPVTARVLPTASAVLASLGDYDRFVAGNKAYVAEVARKLAAAAPDSFEPHLERADAMLESLTIR